MQSTTIPWVVFTSSVISSSPTIVQSHKCFYFESLFPTDWYGDKMAAVRGTSAAGNGKQAHKQPRLTTIHKDNVEHRTFVHVQLDRKNAENPFIHKTQIHWLMGSSPTSFNSFPHVNHETA